MITGLYKALLIGVAAGLAYSIFRYLFKINGQFLIVLTALFTALIGTGVTYLNNSYPGWFTPSEWFSTLYSGNSYIETKPSKKLITLAKYINSKTPLRSKHTTLNKVILTNNSFEYYYTYHPNKAHEMLIDKFKKKAKKLITTQEKCKSFKHVFSEGLYVKYRYSDDDGNKIVNINVTQEDCSP